MATQLTQVCDFGKDHPATATSEVRVGHSTLTFDHCDVHKPDLVKALTEIGYVASKARVGKDSRGSYIAASGHLFTAQDVRAWLVETEQDVSETGRLPREALDEYARAH